MASEGMVVTASPEASLVGARILRQGGNAIDAAIATQFALAVTYPQAGNLGGGGFLIVRMAELRGDRLPRAGSGSGLAPDVSES
jgi:gamma-glutamyltranspeptidase/glutathione hydrolase